MSPAYRSPWMTAELQAFRARMRQLICAEFAPQQPRWREQQHPDAGAWTTAGAGGMLLADVPARYGGGGGTFAHEAVVVEELARAGVQFGSFIQNSVAQYILAYGTEPQKQSWLPRMARGELVGAVAMTEPTAGSDLGGMKTVAKKTGDVYVINGSKSFVTNGWHAGLICLAAKTDVAAAGAKSVSLIMVETRGLQGYRVDRSLAKVGQHDQDTCDLVFEESRVPAGNLLGSAEGQGLSQLMETMSYERLAIGVAAVATAERAVALTAKYVKERKAFGKPLLDLQNTRFTLAECKTAAHVGRVFVDDCIARFIAGTLDDATTAMAKYWLTDCECRVVDECLQLHGGYGYLTDYPIAHMWADSRVHRIYAGTNEILKELIAWSL